FIADGVALPRVGNRANHKIVRERGDLPKVKDPNIGRLPGFGPPHCKQPVRELLNSGGLAVDWTARQTRLNVLLRLAYYRRGAVIQKRRIHAATNGAIAATRGMPRGRGRPPHL